MVELVAGVGDDVTLERSATVGRCDLQGVQLVDVLCLYVVGGLGAPHQAEVGGKHLLSHLAVDGLVDGGCVACAGVAHEAQATRTCCLQEGEQRVLLLGLLELALGSGLDVVGLLTVVELKLGSGLLLGGSGLLGLLLSGSGVFLAGCFLLTAGQTLVELLEVVNDFLGVLGLPELEVCATLEELTHTLRLLDTGHLHHDASLCALDALDVGLDNTELVDTCAYNVEGVVDGRAYLATEHLLHFAV